MENIINFIVNGVCTSSVVIIGCVLNSIAIHIVRKNYDRTNIFYQMLIYLLCLDICVLLTWMNLSGGSVLAARDFYKLDLTDILVICDDFQLPLKTIRMRPSGSAGGQKGLADTITRLSSTTIPRLRVGIGPVPKQQDPPSFVLGKFSKYEQGDLDETIQRAADAAESWVTIGIEASMNRYN